MATIGSSIRWVIRNLVSKFTIGVITITPAFITLWVLWWIFNNIDNILQPAIRAIFGNNIPGLGFAISMFFILMVGLIASNMVGRKIIHYVEMVIPFMPIIRTIYGGVKQIVDSFSGPKRKSGMRPVLTEFPRKGMKTLAFVTNEIETEDGKIFTVFVPTSPNPTSGFLQVVNETEVTPVNISMDEALRMVVSAGRVVPDAVTAELSKHF